MFKKIFIITLTITILFLTDAFSQDKKKILILNSYHQGLSWTDDEIRGIRDSLKSLESQIEYYIEYMDTKRFYGKDYYDIIANLLREKYREIKFDLIFVTDNDALLFAMRYYNSLFKNTPTVFCGINNFSEDLVKDYRKWFTGVAEETDLESTIDIALHLHPNTKRIYVINDITTTGLAMKNMLLKVIPKFAKDVEFIIVENPEMKELVKEVERIPSNSLILLVLVNKDRTGNFFAYEESLELLYPHTNVPIYSFWDFYLGKGVVGGKLTSAFLQGKRAGELGLRILRGEKPENIPIITKSPNEYMFDYKELKRFNISLSSLPKESRVINLPESFFIKYKNTLIAITSGFVFLTSIIFILIVNISKRKKIEKALRLSEEKYRDLYDNAPDMYHSVDKDGIIIECNETEAKMLGYRKEEIIGKPITYFMTEESKKAHETFFPEISKYSFIQLERDFVRKDGSVFTVALNVYVEVDEKGNFVKTKTIGRDITYRKKMEEELKRSKEALRKLSVYLQNIREKERKEIAKEIHDELGQSLTAIKLALFWIKRRAAEELQEKLDETIYIVNSLIKQVQNISNRLRPSLIDHLTLGEAIKWQLMEFERNTSINCKYELMDGEDSLTREVSLTLFRIFQEALTNIARHAHATEVTVKMFRSNGSIVLIVKDNGVGIPEEKIKSPESFGLMAMKERAYSINATLDIKISENGGTELVISVPVKSE